MKLAEYEYKIHLKPGASNTNADALSRINRVVTRSSKLSTSTELPTSTDSQESSELPKPSDTPEHLDTAEPSRSTELSNTPESSENSEPTENSEFFQNLLNMNNSPTPNVTEIVGDLFDTPKDTALAHCVSSDLKMSSGIALQFRRRFGRPQQSHSGRKSVNDVIS